MTTTRRDFLTAAVTAAGAAVTPDLAHAQEHDHDHDHDHQVVPSDPALRVKALESLLVEKGLVDRAALDAIVDAYEHKIGPRNGARVVARAWVDPAYKQRLLTNATAAIAELDYSGPGGGADAGGREYSQGTQSGRVHAVLVLPLASPRLAAGMVQVCALSFARGHRSAWAAA